MMEHFSVALNKEEIVILGGDKDDIHKKHKNKVFIFDTRTDKCSSIVISGAF